MVEDASSNMYVDQEVFEQLKAEYLALKQDMEQKVQSQENMIAAQQSELEDLKIKLENVEQGQDDDEEEEEEEEEPEVVENDTEKPPKEKWLITKKWDAACESISNARKKIWNKIRGKTDEKSPEEEQEAATKSAQ